MFIELQCLILQYTGTVFFSILVRHNCSSHNLLNIRFSLNFSALTEGSTAVTGKMYGTVGVSRGFRVSLTLRLPD